MRDSIKAANRIELIKFSAPKRRQRRGPHAANYQFAAAKPNLDQGMLIRKASIGQSGKTKYNFSLCWTDWAAALYRVVEALYLLAKFSERNTLRDRDSRVILITQSFYISSLELAKSVG
jgi:hypothetical protein